MFRTAFAGFTVAALAAMSGLPSFAQLASQESTFSGVVPAICTVSDQVQATTPMSLNSGGSELSGETNDFSFVSNGAVSVQLRAVSVQAQPAGTAGYAFAGSLNDGGTLIASATPTAASSVVPYNAGLTSDDLFTMGLTISDSGAPLAQGTYTTVLTTDCLAS